LALFHGCGERKNTDKNAYDGTSGASVPDPVAVEAVKVTKGVLSRTVEASGTVYGASEATVVSETQGVVTDVKYELGARVAAGDVLVRVDDKLARLNMESAKSQYETARKSREAGEKLKPAGGIAQSELDRLEASEIAAQTAYETAVKAWEDCSIKAPVGGYVASKDISVSTGSYLNRGMRVARIVDLKTLRVNISVGEREVGQIRENSPAQVKMSAGCAPDSFDARVKAVSAGAEPGTGSFTVVVEWKNTCGPQVKSGMTASVTIPGAGQDTVVVVPTSAMIKREGRDVVLVAEGDRTVVRPVRMGRAAGNRTQIVEGLAPGETVIMSALGTLRPNAPVIVTVKGESGSWQ
jgi:membrane fusion protein (multidrug efflux system)